jgi:alpha-D-ribose 1-methylphosphonate 5-triphosphate diphosphatase PhnM
MATKDDEGIFNTLSKIIDDAFSKVFTEKKKEHRPSTPQYTTIEEYTGKTGKRFRMSKDQKERGLTRQQAFEELYLNEEK